NPVRIRATTFGAAVASEAWPVEAPPQAAEARNSRTTAIDERYTNPSSARRMYYEIEGVLLRDRSFVNRRGDRRPSRRVEEVDGVLDLLERVPELVLQAGQARAQRGRPGLPGAGADPAQLDEVRPAVIRVRHALHVAELGDA